MRQSFILNSTKKLSNNNYFLIRFLTLIFCLFFIVSCTLTKSLEPEKTVSKDSVTSKSHKFIVTGDSRGQVGDESGVNEPVLSKIAAAIRDEKPEFVLFVGDLIYGQANRKALGDQGALDMIHDEFNTWLKVMQPIYSAGIPVYAVRGNHETQQWHPNNPGHKDHRPVWPKTREVWNEVFKGPLTNPKNGPIGEENITFSFLYDNIFIAGMDVYYYTPRPPFVNEDGSIDEYQFHRVNQKWLDTQLAEAMGSHIFTYTHEPAFKLDHTDCLQGNSCPTMQINYSKSRNRFWESLRDAGARVYFCGHDHGYAHVVVKDGDGNPDNDIHQFSLGTAGAGKNLKPVLNGYNAPYTPVLIKCDNSYGYMVVEINGLKVDLTWKRMNDKTGKFEIGERFSYSLKSDK